MAMGPSIHETWCCPCLKLGVALGNEDTYSDTVLAEGKILQGDIGSKGTNPV